MLKLIANCETGEIIEREMTEEELTQWELDQKKAKEAKKQAEANAQAQAEAKATLLERLGITEEEAKLLLG